MISRLLMLGMLMVALLPGAVFSQDISLELGMPGTQFSPGSPFYLDLSVVNIGTALAGSQLFVALSIGSDFWFYPQWVKYPPDLDWMELDIAGYSINTMTLIPEFSWPSGTGAFSGAMFLSAVVHNGVLVSNLSDITFGWSETPQPTPTTSPGIVSVGIMIPVSAGTFTQGSPTTESCRQVDETQFTHTLTRNIAVMETEITRQMWADLKALQPTLPLDMSDWSIMALPAQNNTWYEAVLFANLLSIQNGFTACYYADAGYTQRIDGTNYTSGPFYCDFNADGYRLPSEGEWEYFTRAGTTGPFSCDVPNYNSGNCQDCGPGIFPTLELYCVFCANDSGLCAVAGSKTANPWGLKDVHGNVFEWCWDLYEAYPETAQIDYTGAVSGSARVERGGSWQGIAQLCRSALRYNTSPANRTNNLGFRLVRTID